MQCTTTNLPVSTHTHTRLKALFPGPTGWAGTRKVKPIWILLKQETVSGSGISWAICKSAPCSRQITTPAPHCSVFYRPDALPVTQPTASKHCIQRCQKSSLNEWIYLIENPQDKKGHKTTCTCPLGLKQINGELVFTNFAIQKCDDESTLPQILKLNVVWWRHLAMNRLNLMLVHNLVRNAVAQMHDKRMHNCTDNKKTQCL